MRRFAVSAVSLLLSLACAAAQAQSYPSKPSRVIIPFAAGGGNDVVARVLAAKLASTLGQPFLVENRPGANGFLGSKVVVDAAPDGYTVLMGASGPVSIGPAVFAKMPYVPLRDLAPVTMIGTFPLVLAVSASLPVHNVAELVAYAKARPTQMNYGSTSPTFQLTAELFNLRTGTNFQHIPYKSSTEFTTAVMTGEVTIAFPDPPPAIGMIKSGKIRGLAVTSTKRHPFWPDIPTLAEAGIPDMDVKIFMGLLMPAATPSPVVHRLRDEVAKLLADTEVREKLSGFGVEPDGRSPEDFAKFIAEDIARWTTVAKAANIKLVD